jgi:polyisoprenoid-binding protein YceI
VLKKLLIAAVVLVVLVVGGTAFYINVIREDPPDRLSLESDDGNEAAPAPGGDEGIEGTWTATEGSEAGYRVDEILFGQDATAVGRTSDVSGTLVIEGTEVTTTDIEVDLTTVKSDQERRDGQFQGRIMDTANFPTATFSLTEPIELGDVPVGTEAKTYSATGELTLRGTTKPVTIELSARRNGANIEVQGAVNIVFEEWGIPNPSTGPISTEDDGELEFLVVFARD